MLDRTLVVVDAPRHTERANHTHTEKRAPTDKSVELLREMEKAARDEVTKSIRVGDTTFECVVHSYFDMMNQVQKFRVIFSLNGKKMEVEYETHAPEKTDEWPGELHKKIAEKIAAEVLAPALCAMPNPMFKSR